MLNVLLFFSFPLFQGLLVVELEIASCVIPNEGGNPSLTRSHAPAWERRGMLNTEKKLMQVINPKLIQVTTKMLQKIEDMHSHAGAWEREIFRN